MTDGARGAAGPRETELKLDLDPSDLDRFRALPMLGRPAATAELRARYYDTAASDLQQAGLTLRVRDDGERRVQTVKGEGQGGAGLFDRPEWESAIEGDGPDLDAAAETPLGPVLARQGIRGGLAIRFSTRVTRTTWRLSRDGARIAVTLDQGVIEGAPGSQPVCEVELELEAGPPSALFDLARAMAETVPLRLGVRSKAERGYALGTAPTRYAAEPVRVERPMSAAEGFRAIVHACLRHFRLNEAVLSATRSADALHQGRVALRRLRSALSLFGPILGPERETVAASLRPLSERLGRARNLDVFLERVAHPEVEHDPAEPGLSTLLADLEARRAGAYDDVAATLAAPELRRALLDLVAWVECGAWQAQPPAATPLRRFAQDLLHGRRRRLKRRARHLARLTAPERHRIRVAAKKLRYASEFLSGLYGPRRRRRLGRFVKALTALQEVLGDLNDIDTAHALATELAQPHAGSTGFAIRDLEPFAAGVLAGRQAAREDALVATAGQAARRFRKTRGFWD